MPEQEHSTSHMIQQFVGICNQAISRHYDEFPYRQVIEVLQKKGLNHQLRVFEDITRSSCEVRWDRDHIEVEEAGCGCNCPIYHLSKRHVEHVLAAPDVYINDPSLMDLGWLKA